MTMKTFFATLAVTALLAPGLAQAAEPKLVGTYSDWEVYSKAEGNETICYALAEAKSKAPSNVKHGDIYFMVANWKSGAASEQPSLLTGYSLKVSSPPSARVGSAKYPMYVAQNEGFIMDNSQERKLVKAMRRGSNMRISAVSQRGTATNYEFSLKGVTAALKKAKSVCS